MDTICTQCGAKLPRVNVRYCNNCGALVSSNTVSSSLPSTKAMASSSLANEQTQSSRPPLREQIAQQPPSRPVRRPFSDEPPAWMQQLDQRPTSRITSDPLRMKRTMDASKEESHVPRQDMADKPTQASIPSAAPVAQSAPSAPARELHIKVWPQEEAVLTDVAVSEDASQPAQAKGRQGVDDILDDLPTRPVAAPAKSPAQPVASVQPVSERRDVTTGTIEHMSTVPLQAQPPVTPPSRPIVQPQARPQSQPGRSYTQGPISQVPPIAPSASAQGGVQNPVSQVSPAAPVAPTRNVVQRPVSQVPPVSPSFPSQGGVQRPVSQIPVPPAMPAAPSQGGVQRPVSQVPPVSYVPPVAPVRERPQTPLVASEPAVKRRAKSGGRAPVLPGLVAFVVLVVGGLAALIVIRQPFTVPASTQPQQAFTSAQLGLSVLYPSGWTAKVDQSRTSVLFSDSSHTGQVNVVVGSASGGVTQYLNSEAKSLGMTAVRQGAPLSFAGASWQVLQGNVQQTGASYACVLLATAHGNHIYTIVQMAPQTIYSQEDQLVFSPFRSSFHFLA